MRSCFVDLTGQLPVQWDGMIEGLAAQSREMIFDNLVVV